MEELKKREVALNVEVAELIEEIDSDQALTRFTAMAALMRQQVRGVNLMPRAQEDLEVFLTFGFLDDLDRDDEEGEGGAEEEEEVVGDVIREDVGLSRVGGDEEEA